MSQEKAFRTFTIYENQKRKNLQWASPPSEERPTWSDENGVPKSKEDIDKLVKPMGGKWTGEWTIDNTNEKLGKDGWEFASAWPKFAKRDARDWANPGDSVRRRKWVRTMKCTPASSASSSRKSKASPASSHEQRQRDIVRAIKILNGTNKDINSFMKRIGTEKDSSKDRAQFDEVFESTEKRLEEVEMELENLKADGGARMHGTVFKLKKDLDRVKNDLHSSRSSYEMKVRRNPLHSVDFSEDGGSSYDSGGKMNDAVKASPPQANPEQQYHYTEHEQSAYPGAGLDSESRKIDAQLISIDEVQINEAIMLEREQEIGKINKDLLQVQEITQDLHDMVEGQQAGIDAITENVTQTQIRTDAGFKDVQQAEKSQKQNCVLS